MTETCMPATSLWENRTPEEAAPALLAACGATTHARRRAERLRSLLTAMKRYGTIDDDNQETWNENVDPESLTRDRESQNEIERARRLRNAACTLLADTLSKLKLEVWKGRVITDQSAVREHLRTFPNVLGETAIDAAAELVEWDNSANDARARTASARAQEATDLIETADLEDEFYCERTGTGAVLEHQAGRDRSWNEWSKEQRAAADRIAELDNEAADEIIGILGNVNLEYSRHYITPTTHSDGMIDTDDSDSPFDEYEVNDHGNVTYRVLGVEVWACV